MSLKRSRSRSKSPAPSKKVANDDKGSADTMSVEETNKLRKSLGLAPLADAKTAESEAQAEADARKKTQDKREKEEKSKKDERKKREAKIKKRLTDGDSLGTELKKETGGSAADWVKRSRKATKARKEAEERARLLAEQEEQEKPDYDTKALKGLKVAHTSDQFKEGRNIILTLKDSYILNDDCSAENVDEATLENVDIVAEETVEKNKKLKAQTRVYDVYDEDNQELLPQYSEEKEKETMRLEGDEDERERKINSIRDKLKKTVPKEEEDGKGTKYDLGGMELVVPSDYLPSEPAKFKKRRRKKKDGKSTRRTRAKVDDKDKTESFLAIEQTMEEHQQDHGSRAGGSKAAREKELADRQKALKDGSYLKALNKAEAQSKKLLQEVENIFEDDNEEELASSLDRARRLTLARKEEARARKKLKKEQREERINRSKMLADQVKALPKKEEGGDMEDDGEVKEGDSLVITSTTNFCRGMGTKEEDEEQEQEKAMKAAAKAEAQGRKKAAKAEKADQDNEDRDSDDDEDDSDLSMDGDEDDENFMQDEPLVAGGVAQALALAKMRGLLKDEVKQAGRSKDESYTFEDPAPDISIVHLDEFGRPMKPKEAFRKLSHVFHGRKPGPVKQEKKLKQFREEQRRGRLLFGDRKSTLDKLIKRQKKSGEAYVILDAKGGQALQKGRSAYAPKPEKTATKTPAAEPYERGAGKIQMSLGGKKK